MFKINTFLVQFLKCLFSLKKTKMQKDFYVYNFRYLNACFIYVCNKSYISIIFNKTQLTISFVVGFKFESSVNY